MKSQDKPMSDKDRARFDELSAKRANPNVPPPDVRTEDEEMEWRKLSERDAAARDAQQQHAADDQRKEQQDHRRADVKDAEARIKQLLDMPRRTPEEDEELAERRQFVADNS